VVIADKLKLVFFDTAEGTIGETQFDWLEGQLSDTAHVKLVGTHFPMYDGPKPMIWRLASTAERHRLESMLRAGGARGYVSGHIHGWRHVDVAGVNHFTVGTMPPTEEELDYGRLGYLLFTFAHDSLSWERIEF
jgi:3',5'-cyclic AMP phosphodiesterase CpdA